MIRIKSLSKHYANTAALNCVSLAIPQGVIFGFLGPNGAGKTTLIRILTGIIAPDSGQISLNEKPLSQLNVKRIGGCIFSNNSLHRKYVFCYSGTYKQ